MDSVQLRFGTLSMATISGESRTRIGQGWNLEGSRTLPSQRKVPRPDAALVYKIDVGRDIKNVVRTAQCLARTQGKILTMKYFHAPLEAHKAFKEILEGDSTTWNGMGVSWLFGLSSSLAIKSLLIILIGPCLTIGGRVLTKIYALKNFQFQRGDLWATYTNLFQIKCISNHNSKSTVAQKEGAA